ncbi:MAG: formylglycine-generating enzyme family protein, partial [Phycisphaerales bacterium]
THTNRHLGLRVARSVSGWEICDNGIDDDGDGLVDCDDPDCVGRSGCEVGDWAAVLEPLPDPSVVTDLGLLASIVSTGLPWRVLDTETGIEMLLVPPGTYARGCSPATGGECDANELPVHQVTITRPFYLSRFEVTQGQWLSVMGSNPSYWGPEQYGPDSVMEMLPVEQVSWAMVQEFEASTGLRLPTEAEWEYACRAGTTTAFNGGSNDVWSALVLGWFRSFNAANGLVPRTHAVGRLSPNRLGLYDMHGNVAEWVEDWMAPYSGHNGQTDPTGPLTGTRRVVRGGHYDASANLGRSSSRDDASPTHTNRHLGLRVARSVSG